MPQFLIQYVFDGSGKAYIDADTPEQAEEMFYEGEFSDEEEDGQDYVITDVVEQ